MASGCVALVLTATECVCVSLIAHPSGYSLSDKHLAHATHVKGERVWEGAPIPCDSEEAIFRALKLQYKVRVRVCQCRCCALTRCTCALS